ncbi:MAG TPA: serine/threonine-protein kinase, partial [Gemmatimonadales bacterium]
MKVCPTCSTEYADEVLFCQKDGTTLRGAAKSGDLVGNVVADRYRIVKKLGEGGMGAVYLGEHVKMGRKSAIKVMTQSMAHDPDAIARFNREAANAARINHANVCAIYDFGETDDGLIYLAMEFIEGSALTDLIDSEGALAVPRATRILQQTADALQAAHDLGIVHRDLKPDNIMITKGRENADVVKVVDFGIAKAMGGEEGQKVTKTGLVVGTPEYMSPEQLSGDKLDGRSDLYSLALVYYRMLTGTLPFHAESAQETMIKRLTDDPLPLNEAKPDGS